MIGDRDLGEFRAGYYRLLSALLGREPTAAFLESLLAGVAARVDGASRISPRLGEGWSELAAAAHPGPDVSRIADEFARLFIGPRPLLDPYESHYLAGRFYAWPLAAVREFLGQVGIGKDLRASDPEDALAFECEVMSRLIERQAAAGDPDGEARWAHLQGEFLKHHLLVWAPRFAADLSRSEASAFYRAVGKILEAFLALEREVIAPWGPEGFKSYEEVREAVVRRGQWRGPLVDAPGGGEAEPPTREGR